MSMSCEAALLQSHQEHLSALRKPDELKAAGNSTVEALGHTVKVCREVVATARLIQAYPTANLEVKETSLKQRVPGTLMNDRPSEEESEQAIFDLKKVSGHVRELQRLDKVQQAMFKTMGEALGEEGKLCETTSAAQEKFEQDMKAIHEKMLKTGSEAPFIYFNRPGKTKTGHTVAEEFQRFSAEAKATLEKKTEQAIQLGGVQVKLLSQLNGHAARTNSEEVGALLDQLTDLVGVNAPAVTQEEEAVERLGNEPAGRDSSNHSSAEVLAYAREKLESLKKYVAIREEESKPAMTDAEIENNFKLAAHGYLSQTMTLTEAQFNELSAELKSMISECQTLNLRLQERKNSLATLAQTLESDQIMLQSVLEAEQEARDTLNTELEKQTGFNLKDVTDREHIAALTRTQVDELVSGDLRAEEDLRTSKQSILDLLKQIQEKHEEPQEPVEATASSEAVTESVVTEQQRRRRQLAEKIQLLVDQFEEWHQKNS